MANPIRWWKQRSKRFKIGSGLGLLAALGVGAWLFFGVFAFHLLWVDDKVDEAPPTFDAAVAATTTTAPADPAGDDETTPPTSDTEPTEPTEPAEPVVRTEHDGTFVDGDHPTSGTAIVLGDGTGQRFLRFEDFETDNGPDLDVYLVPSGADGVDDRIELGALKGNIGNQNYEVPEDVDLERYDRVVIWCVRFAVSFGSADLMPTAA